MPNYVFRSTGEPAGFVSGNFLFDIQSGEALAQVRGSHVFKLDGQYVGDLKDEMVVKTAHWQPAVEPAWKRPSAARPPTPPRRIGRLGRIDAWDDLTDTPTVENGDNPD